MAIHVSGVLEAVHDGEHLLSQLHALTDEHEKQRELPWSVDDAPPRYIEAMTRGIVGLRLRVTEIAGSWKLAQHKSDADREGVINGLRAETDAGAQAMGALMETAEDKGDTR